jgi:hypothetical protein
MLVPFTAWASLEQNPLQGETNEIMMYINLYAVQLQCQMYQLSSKILQMRM